MSAGTKLAAPIIESKLAAQINQTGIMIPFLMNKAVGWSEFKEMSLWIKTIQTSTTVAIWKCSKESILFKDGKYWAFFEKDPSDKQDSYFKIGQNYKVQLAYIQNDETIGHYSSVGVFKFSAKPEVQIKGLNENEINVNIYNYTGFYENVKDSSEKVYSYEFILYNNEGKIVATSGEQLHNSSKDTSSTFSTDEWTLEYSLENEKNYLVVYKIKTVNNLEYSSIPYRIYNGTTFDSNIVKYCDFSSEVNQDEGYVELTLQPKNKQEKYLNGKFILLRSSDEDNFQTWHQLTKFIVKSHNTLNSFFICRDYCVSQGVTYQYAIQAYNDKGIYANKQLAKQKKIFVDFEDMFLTDKNRQLKIKFNPKVTSFKNTLLEVKMDTMGSKYPFFFKNGNVSYKEFPISGLISLLMDEENTFMTGIPITLKTRSSTPADKEHIKDLPTNLSAENIRKERDFKMEVLKWLTNGEPKLFRSPAEGNYIVRLMNTSLSPNDTLGRMLHTFTCTAYEIDDFTFTNLRKYGMMMEEIVENGGLEFKTIRLGKDEVYNGIVNDLSACTATIQAQPFTKLRYRLMRDKEWNSLEIGMQGIYTFPSEILSDNPLAAIAPPAENVSKGKLYWETDLIINYATYNPQNSLNFNLVDSVSLKDQVRQIIGNNESAISKLTDTNNALISLGLIHYLKVSARPIISVDEVNPISDTEDQYSFKIGGIYHTPTVEEILKYKDKVSGDVVYYDGNTRRRLGSLDDIDFTFGLYSWSNKIDMKGSLATNKLATTPSNLEDDIDISKILQCTSGRLILKNLPDVDNLWLGNGLYADIAYQEISRVYTIEVTEGSNIKNLKEAWNELKTSNPPADPAQISSAYTEYYNALTAYIEGSVNVDAI